MNIIILQFKVNTPFLKNQVNNHFIFNIK